MKENILIIDDKGTERVIRPQFEKARVTKPTPDTPKTLSELLETLDTLHQKKKEFEFLKDEISVKVESPTPFFYICFLSDIHFDREGFDAPAFKQYLEAIKNYPIYTVLVGDIGSYFSPTRHPRGMLEGVVTADEQTVIVRSFLKEYQDKILGCVMGNHEYFVNESSGIEIARWMTQDLHVPLLKNGGLLHLQVNEQDYDIYLFHKIARYYSSLNLTNALRRAMELGRDADMVVCGHKEIGAMEKVVHQDKKPFLLQLGSFKKEDRFEREMGMIPNPQVFYPVVRFRGDKRNIEATEDLNQALDEIEAIEYYYRMLALGLLGSHGK